MNAVDKIPGVSRTLTIQDNTKTRMKRRIRCIILKLLITTPVVLKGHTGEKLVLRASRSGTDVASSQWLTLDKVKRCKMSMLLTSMSTLNPSSEFQSNRKFIILKACGDHLQLIRTTTLWLCHISFRTFNSSAMHLSADS